jgi:glycosyltransferase involved in cell wall biosynthesis
MRVLMVPHAYWPSVGGVERVVQQLGRFLCQQGHQAAVLTDTCPSAPCHEMIDGLPIWRVPFVCWQRSRAWQFWMNWPGAQRRIQHLVTEFRPDVVHLHVTAGNAPYAQFAASSARCPMVVTTHGSHLRALNQQGLHLERRLCEKALCITHCARSALEQFALKHPGLAERSCVIHNGIAPEEFLAVPAQPTLDPCVVYVGRLDARKGVDTLLRAWSQAAHEGAQLIIAGDGPARLTLERLAEGLSLRNVQWTGALPAQQIIALLKAASGFVLPSLEEAFPMAVLEAMAVGCPIVATRVGGIPEQIQDGVHGLLVPPGDPSALAAAIGRLLSDRCLARSLGTRAAQRAATEFHWSQIVRGYVAAYRGDGAAN